MRAMASTTSNCTKLACSVTWVGVAIRNLWTKANYVIEQRTRRAPNGMSGWLLTALIDTFHRVLENSNVGATRRFFTASRYAVQGPVWQTSSAWMMSPTL